MGCHRHPAAATQLVPQIAHVLACLVHRGHSIDRVSAPAGGARQTILGARVRPLLHRRLPAWCHDGATPASPEPALVPELLVTDLDRSLAFWRDLSGFEVSYDRPEERFAYLTLGSAHLMLEEICDGRHWMTGPLDAPFGRGINFQVSVPDAESLSRTLASAGVEFYLPLETKWYRVADEEAGVQQFLVTDPDGYLVRFQSSLGRRPVSRE